jgi:hypothetical protein
MSKYLLLILLAFPMLAFAQSKNQYAPFTLGDKNEITAFVEDMPLFPRYKYLFEKYGYSGNGYSWEGIIIQILETLLSDKNRNLGFDISQTLVNIQKLFLF